MHTIFRKERATASSDKRLRWTSKWKTFSPKTFFQKSLFSRPILGPLGVLSVPRSITGHIEFQPANSQNLPPKNLKLKTLKKLRAALKGARPR
jgi:hypothetical protein